MNILAIADRPPKQSIRQTLTEYSIDMICTLGDLEYSFLKELSLITNIPKLGIYGNHCSPTYFNELDIINMHLQTYHCQGLLFGGFEGCVRYKTSSYEKMYTQEESQLLLKDFPAVDVMLCHCPPYGVNDDVEDISHTGFLGLKEYVDRVHPSHLFHGHTYPHEKDNLVTNYGHTTIHYIFEDQIVSL